MKTIGGGTVRHGGGLAWIECPDHREAIGECTSAGTLDVLWNDKPMESFDLRAGDYLLVADGATVPPKTWLFSRDPWSRRVRADIPRGVTATVRWSEAPLRVKEDDVTGLVRHGFAPGERDVTVALRHDGGKVTLAVPRDATPIVMDGILVVRGQLLAVSAAGVRRDEALSGIDALRDYLNGRRADGRFAAPVAPCDGRVETIEPTRMTVRAAGGTLHTVRKRLRGYPSVREGDEVRAGDALDHGERDHHALLRVWGEERLTRHMLEELEIETARRSLSIPRGYWVLVVRAMLAWRRVLRPGDTGLRRHRVLSRRDFERVQRETGARGGAPAVAAPVLRGVANIARQRLAR